MPLFKRRRAEPERRRTFTEELQDRGLEKNAPIYKKRCGNMFDDFLKQRDKEGFTPDEMLYPKVYHGNNIVTDLDAVSYMLHAISQNRAQNKIRRWQVRGDNPTRTWNWNREQVGKSPVFETHSYYDKSDRGGMHSFIGLRFTGVNDLEGSALYDEDTEVVRTAFERKRIVVGYGAPSPAFRDAFHLNSTGEGGKGTLINDIGHAATASTETPIDSTRAMKLLDAIPKFQQRFNYNVATANCNDFAMTMSKLVGVRAPAELYDHVTGPIAAAPDMKKSAGKKQGGGTEIITRSNAQVYGNPSRDSDMLPMMEQFGREMQQAIVSDGGTRKLPGIQPAFERFMDKLRTVNGKSVVREILLGNGLSEDAEKNDSMAFVVLEDMQRELSEIIEEAQKLVTVSKNTKHPHVNQALWNLIVTLEGHYEYVENRLIMKRDNRVRRVLRSRIEAQRAVAGQDQTPQPNPQLQT